MNTGAGGVPTGVLPNNGIVIAQSSGNFLIQCRSGSTMTDVGQFVDLSGNTFNIGQTFGAFRVGTIGTEPGTVTLRNNGAPTNADNGVYSCRIPDESGAMVDVNIGVYRNGFNSEFD